MARKKGRMALGADGHPGLRYELTDDGIEKVEDLLPCLSRGGTSADHRATPYDMSRALRSRTYWRERPVRYDKRETMYGRLRTRARSVCTASTGVSGPFDKIDDG